MIYRQPTDEIGYLPDLRRRPLKAVELFWEYRYSGVKHCAAIYVIAQSHVKQNFYLESCRLVPCAR